jgi:hypothetical protein
MATVKWVLAFAEATVSSVVTQEFLISDSSLGFKAEAKSWL